METPAQLIDKLVIANLKIFKAEDIKRNEDATDDDIVGATKLTNRLNKYRNELIVELDELLGFENNNNVKTYGNTI